jgi:plasmid maintenance system killer protein
MVILWCDSWLKPLFSSDRGAEIYSATAKKAFVQVEFVTSCGFCKVAIMHDQCANKHISF